MARTASSRSVVFHPCSRIHDFLFGYNTQGLALATLANLSPMYPSPSVTNLAHLQRVSSERNQRAGDTAAVPNDFAFYVVMFKKFSSNLPLGLTVDAFSKFFTELFTFQTTEERDTFYKSAKALLDNPLYIVLAITVPIFSSDDPSQLTHFIVGAALYLYDNKHGSYITLLGVTDIGDPSTCTLSTRYFIDPKEACVLSTKPSSFRGRGLASFLLSTIQLIGHLLYHTPKNPLTSTINIPCSEMDVDVTFRHHIYLQARVEMGSAYVMYVKMGFTSPAAENGRYRCYSYRQQCPVLMSKLSKSDRAGYIIDDNFLRLLVLKRYLVNVFPPHASKSPKVDSATDVWHAIGLPRHQYLSSALVPPLNNPDSRAFTNAAYLQLLKCRVNLASEPFQYHLFRQPFQDLTSLQPIPVDRSVTENSRDHSDHRFVSGFPLELCDIRRLMFRGLSAFIGDKARFDIFEAIAASLYTEGKAPTSEDLEYSHLEMTLELRLNVMAFYQRCARFPFTSPLLDHWSTLANKEYHNAAANNFLSISGLSDFKGNLKSFSKDRLLWAKNFRVLSQRLFVTPSSTPNPPLWMDLYAIQLMFLQKERPILFAPVYGFVQILEEGKLSAHPVVGDLSQLTNIEGMLLDNPSFVLPPLFTVVPILATTITSFGYLSYVAPTEETDVALCHQIRDFNPEDHKDILAFRAQSRLSVFYAAADKCKKSFKAGHCASNNLCMLQEDKKADPKVQRCPKCRRGVHLGCGYVRPSTENALFQTTCLACFDKHGRVFGPPKAPPKAPSSVARRTVLLPTKSSSRHTRSADVPEDDVQVDTRHASSKARDVQVDKNNPPYMHPKGLAPKAVWWIDEEGDYEAATASLSYLSNNIPEPKHVYSKKEMEAFASFKWKKTHEPYILPKSFKEITSAAYALEKFLKESEASKEYPPPHGLHRPDVAYTSQELVNICCLVDLGREFSIDTHFRQKRKTKFSLQIDSYVIAEDRTLKAYASSRSKKRDPPGVLVLMQVYRTWLKSYLDWFDPDLYQYLLSNADGTPVTRVGSQLAAEEDIDYQFSGVDDFDPLMVPLSKSHEAVSTGTHQFGVEIDGEYLPYCKDAYTDTPGLSQQVHLPSYDKKLTTSCNPSGFEYVPVARLPTIKVPKIHMQITAIRADLLQAKKGEPLLRWLGLQDGKYVSLPIEWVEANFDAELLEEALRRSKSALAGERPLTRFLTLPVGDSREDDPPVSIRDNQGVNYYYQGAVDNCVIGGLVNAVYWMLGPDESDALLKDFTPTVLDKIWFKFVQQVNRVLHNGYLLKRIKTQVGVLQVDDAYPLVVHLKATDNSQTHAVCIFQGRIYDSASRYVLEKTMAALNWCCGAYPFARHLRIYRLLPVEEKEEHPHRPGRKKRSRKRYI